MVSPRSDSQESHLAKDLNERQREAVYLFEVEGFIPAEYGIVQVSNRRIEAEVRGDLLDPSRHILKGLVKAATYHLLEVRERQGRWQVQVVLDV